MVASAGGEEYRQAIQSLLLSLDIDSLIVIYTPIDPTGVDRAIDGIRRGITGARLAGAKNKPVLACVMAESMRAAPLLAAAEVVPTYAFPENAVRALGKVVAYAGWRRQPPGLHWDFDDIDAAAGRAICLKALAENAGGWLEVDEVSRLLHAFGLPVVAGAVAHDPDGAAALAAVFGFPVVAKVGSTRVLHKTDAGGVRLNLADASEVRSAFSDIEARIREIAPEAASDGVLIQPMVSAGVEAFVGIAHDPIFGPLIGFGLGGVDVELLGDVRFRVAPLTDRDADELLREIRGYPVLLGQRRRPAVDLDALREILLRVSRLAEEIPEIAELDLNPVMAMAVGTGCRIVDARVRVAATRP
jgi:acyl-CoA synthetase (NDP forming)